MSQIRYIEPIHPLVIRRKCVYSVQITCTHIMLSRFLLATYTHRSSVTMLFAPSRKATNTNKTWQRATWTSLKNATTSAVISSKHLGAQGEGSDELVHWFLMWTIPSLQPARGSVHQGGRALIEEQLKSILEAAHMGLGCGNPIATASIKKLWVKCLHCCSISIIIFFQGETIVYIDAGLNCQTIRSRELSSGLGSPYCSPSSLSRILTKAVVVRNPGVVATIKEMMKHGQPYLRAFPTQRREHG